MSSPEESYNQPLQPDSQANIHGDEKTGGRQGIVNQDSVAVKSDPGSPLPIPALPELAANTAKRSNLLPTDVIRPIKGGAPDPAGEESGKNEQRRYEGEGSRVIDAPDIDIWLKFSKNAREVHKRILVGLVADKEYWEFLKTVDGIDIEAGLKEIHQLASDNLDLSNPHLIQYRTTRI